MGGGLGEKPRPLLLILEKRMSHLAEPLEASAE